MKQYKIIAAMAVVFAMVALILPASASADTIKLEYGPGGWYDGSDYGGYNDYRAYEMKVWVTADSLGLYDYETYGYCVDPYTYMTGMEYDVNVTNLDDASLRYDVDLYYQVAWLLDLYAPVAGTADANYKAIAIQGLIWETLTGNHIFAPDWYFESTAYGFYSDYASDLNQGQDRREIGSRQDDAGPNLHGGPNQVFTGLHGQSPRRRRSAGADHGGAAGYRAFGPGLYEVQKARLKPKTEHDENQAIPAAFVKPGVASHAKRPAQRQGGPFSFPYLWGKNHPAKTLPMIRHPLQRAPFSTPP